MLEQLWCKKDSNLGTCSKELQVKGAEPEFVYGS